LVADFDLDFDLDLAIAGAFGDCAALSGAALALQGSLRENGQKWPVLGGLAALQLGLRPL
jgi:hypothetical protein